MPLVFVESTRLQVPIGFGCAATKPSKENENLATPRMPRCLVILRGGVTGQPLDLSDPATLNTTVINGDMITVTGRPQEFYYIAGRINYPGQKTYQSGITLLQAILAAGGTSRQNESKVEISREGTDGRLVTTRFNLKDIKGGVIQDPKVLPGDRIEVLN